MAYHHVHAENQSNHVHKDYIRTKLMWGAANEFRTPRPEKEKGAGTAYVYDIKHARNVHMLKFKI